MNRGIAAALVPVAMLGFGLDRAMAQQPEPPLTPREKMMLDRIEQLEKRLAAVEAKTGSAPAAPSDSQPAAPASEQDSTSLPGFVSGTTLNFDFDGYYSYNFNHPVGRVNLLRAYDVTSNSFSINQAGIAIERLPDASAGRRLGYRLDLMFGQATETLQGGAQNEPRPQVYRNIYQAFGSYVAPVGKGLNLDFGKFTSDLGYEGSYTKDQLNYSRGFYFNFLPFYHMGLRATYNFNKKLSLEYLLVNGGNQTEAFSNFKSNGFFFTITPTKNISWNVDYFFGEQGRDVEPLLNPGIPALPTQPGLSTVPVIPRPDGRQHIFDTYASWRATPKLFLVAEADYVVNRNLQRSSPMRVAGGTGYFRYQFVPKFSLAGRYEYLSDRGGLFTGVTQAIKDTTVTATYQPRDGFQMRWEYRRDFSNRPFFLTSNPSVLKKHQDTAILGLTWWFGGKQGEW